MDPGWCEWIERRPSPNFTKGRKSPIVDVGVIHYTGGASLTSAIEWLCDPRSKVSAHFVVAKTGIPYQLVSVLDAAWHCGRSRFGDRTGVNDFSVGIELVNRGPLPDGGWDPYWDRQIAGLLAVMDWLRHGQGFHLQYVGHSDVAVPKGRKQDPGPVFPWEKLAR